MIHRYTSLILVRVMAVMLAATLAVQLFNFLLLQSVPLPRPPVFTPVQVAEAMRAQRGLERQFHVIHTRAPLPTLAGPATEMVAQLARELGVQPASIRVTLNDPPFAYAPGPGGPHPGFREPRPGSDLVMIGDFMASVLQPDGQWLSLTPVRSGMAAWRSGLTLWLIGALLAVTPFAWFLARWVTKPIAVFAAAAERIGRDPHTPPLVVRGPTRLILPPTIPENVACAQARAIGNRKFRLVLTQVVASSSRATSFELSTTGQCHPM